MQRTVTTPVPDGYQAVYFRHEFTLAAGQIPAALALRVYIDDGCIIAGSKGSIATRPASISARMSRSLMSTGRNLPPAALG